MPRTQRFLTLSLALVLGLSRTLPVGAADDGAGRNFSFRDLTPVHLIAQTIGKIGDFNVVVEPSIILGVSFEQVGVTPLEALAALAAGSGQHLTRVPYGTHPTYLLTAFPRDPATMTEITSSKDGGAVDFDFRKPTPVSVILQTMGKMGSQPVRWGGAMDPFMTLELRGLTPLEAIQVVRDVLGSPVTQEGETLVLGSTPTPPRTGIPPVSAPPVAVAPAQTGADPLKRAFGAASLPQPGVQGPFPGQGMIPGTSPGAPPSFRILAISGEEPSFVAVIEYMGETYIVQPGAKVPDEWQTVFEVTSVTSDQVEVFVPSMNRVVRRSL